MPEFQPTEEQTAIVEAARNTSDNLLVNALAGAAKTSTLVLIAEALAPTPMLCLAFNKKIADEMKERLPVQCEARTLNSLGLAAWKDYLRAWPKLDTKKTYTIVQGLVEKADPEERRHLYENFSEIMQAVDKGKSAGYVPNNKFPYAKGLLTDADFYESLDEEPSPLMWDVIRAASIISIEQGLKGMIDFNDQILLPTVFPATFPQYPVTLVDESQDLSALNHMMLGKIVRGKRLIAVGDPCQAIYGFRGAHQNSMDILKERFKMKEFTLSISFRCPQAVVREAQWRAPHMRWPEWAKPGLVTTIPTWDADTFQPDSAIVCRNNAPLFSLAMKLMRHGRYPQLLGNDLGKGLVKQMKKLGKPGMPIREVRVAIENWRAEKLEKSRAPDTIHDKAECMLAFCEDSETLADAMARAEHLFSQTGPIKLMTGHKSKGLEFENVYLLNIELVRVDKEQQEKNLKYVMQTRAKEALYYIRMEGFDDD